MQGLKAAMAVFCTACICAELVAQITESGWARRGIKVVAGLYILAAALHVLPQLKAEGNVFSVPTVSSVELGTWEQAALALPTGGWRLCRGHACPAFRIG